MNIKYAIFLCIYWTKDGSLKADILNKFILSVIEEFVYYGITDEFKNLGASYILTALTLVNQDVANALPWLYHSVVP